MSNFEIRWALLDKLHSGGTFMIGLTHEGEITNFLEEFFGQYNRKVLVNMGENIDRNVEAKHHQHLFLT